VDQTPVDNQPVATPPDLPPPADPPPSGPRWPAGGDRGSASWLPYVLPFLVYMVVGMFEPPAPDPAIALLTPEEQKFWEEGQEHTMVRLMGIRYEHYPKIYSIKIGATVLTMLLCLPGYWKFPFRISGLAILVGVVGVVLWIALCSLHLEPKILGPMGLMSVENLGDRPAFNPFEQLAGDKTWMVTFLAIRFLGLALIVPIIEEFFLRGFLMRFVMDADWWEIPFGHVNMLAIIAGTAVPMLMHPGELFASFVWFSMVTWLMVRTRNIWDCVAAHVVTNLLLGIYVVTTGNWWLW
jgi:hypothetical protein